MARFAGSKRVAWSVIGLMGNMGDMGTGTLFGHEDKAAASRRTPNASRLPTPTASAPAR